MTDQLTGVGARDDYASKTSSQKLGRYVSAGQGESGKNDHIIPFLFKGERPNISFPECRLLIRILGSGRKDTEYGK